MLAIERRTEIMRIIRQEQSVRVAELSAKFEVAEETIRRDLDKLDKEGKLKKTYGGAVLIENVSEDQSFNVRMKRNMAEKRRIASFANELIEDGETVFIDMSTTALELIKHVDTSKHITVLTNSLTALVELGQRENIKLIGIGGAYDEASLSMTGPMTHKFIDHYYADKTLFSVRGITKERGIMDTKEHLAEIKRFMIKNARETILLADSSKFGNSALISVADMEDIDIVVTDYKMDQQWKDYFANNDVEVYIAK